MIARADHPTTEALLERALQEISSAPASAEEHLAEALSLATSLGDDGLIGRCHYLLGTLRIFQRQFESARELLECARERFVACRDTERELEVMRMTGNLWLNAGDCHRALEILEKCLQMHRAHDVTKSLSLLLADIASVHTGLGDPVRAAAYYDQALFEAWNHGHDTTIDLVFANSAQIYVQLGLFDTARAQLEQAAERLASSRHLPLRCIVHHELVAVELQAGDLEAAGRNAAAALEIAAAVDIDECHRWAYGCAIDHAVAARDIARATSLLDALKRREETAGTGRDDRYHRLDGKVAAITGEIDRSIASYTSALEIVRRSGDRSRQRTLLGELYSILKEAGRAKEAMTQLEELARVTEELYRTASRGAVDGLVQSFRRADEEKREHGEQVRRVTLERELERRAQESAAMALSLAEAAEAMTVTAARLEAIAPSAGTKGAELRKLARDIRSRASRGESWQRFLDLLESHDAAFTRELRNVAPQITSSEIRLARLLRIGLSTKEIAEIMSVTETTVETYRHRIRKKSGLVAGDNLAVFLRAL